MDSLQDVWNGICDLIRPEFSSIAYNTWIGCLTPVSLDSEGLTLSVRSVFQKKIINENYLSHISAAFSQIMGFSAPILIRAEEENKPAAPAGSSQIPDGARQYTFDNFIIAPSNSFAHAASLAVSKNPGKTYNPLFIYGNSGLGKTHLLSAISNAIRDNFPEYRVVSIQGEDFVNEFVEAIQKNQHQEFRAKYRTCDVLILDDVQFIANKPGTQDEFFHTFESLHRAGKQIVLSSDRPPRDILSLDSRLRSRLETGLADIAPPDYETRVAIIHNKAEQLGLSLEEDIVEYIANKLKSNIRQIQAVIQTINAKSTINGTAPSLSLTVEICRDIISDVSHPAITVDVIKDEISRTYQIPRDAFTSPSRSAQVSLARQIAMYVTHQLTPLTLKEIGEEFGGRNYSTVHYSIEKTEQELKENRELKAAVEDIIKNLRNRE